MERFPRRRYTTRMAKTHSITGTYRITHMDEWDQEYVDAEAPAYIRFDRRSDGRFQFGYVHGWLESEETKREGKPAIEFTWQGNNDTDPANGRGWAVLEDDGTMKGKLFTHESDSSGFTAQKMDKGGRKAKSAPTL